MNNVKEKSNHNNLSINVISFDLDKRVKRLQTAYTKILYDRTIYQ